MQQGKIKTTTTTTTAAASFFFFFQRLLPHLVASSEKVRSKVERNLNVLLSLHMITAIMMFMCVAGVRAADAAVAGDEDDDDDDQCISIRNLTELNMNRNMCVCLNVFLNSSGFFSNFFVFFLYFNLMLILR